MQWKVYFQCLAVVETKRWSRQQKSTDKEYLGARLTWLGVSWTTVMLSPLCSPVALKGQGGAFLFVFLNNIC